MLAALGMGALLSSASLLGLAERQPLGTQRDVVLGTAEVVDRLAHFLSLNRPADALAAALDGEEKVYDVEALIAGARATTIVADESPEPDDAAGGTEPSGDEQTGAPEPDDPDDPAAPPVPADCAPIEPATPGDSAESTDADGAIEVTDPQEPTPGDETADPAEVADPGEPSAGDSTVEVTDPGEPTEATDPGDPTAGDDPNDPTASDDPGEPTEATDPDEPTASVAPNEPTASDDPNEPTEATDPDEPTASVAPNEPTASDDPNEPTPGAEPVDADALDDPADSVACPPGYAPVGGTAGTAVTTTTTPVTTTTTTPVTTTTTTPVTTTTATPVTTTTTAGFDAPRTPEEDQPLRMYVGGDSISRDLGEGLARLTPADLVAIDLDPRPATGLSRPDFFDWAQHLAGVLTESEADVIVVLFGANDFQNVEYEGEILNRYTDEWLDRYEERVGRIMTLLSQPDVQTVWVGQPPVRESRLSDGLSRLNEVYAAQAEQHPQVTFVDTWALFSNNEGGYADEIDGERLRREDGVHLTVTGGNRLAGAVWEVVAPAWDLD